MSLFRLFFAPLVLATLPVAAGAQSVEEFFDSLVLHEIRLYVHPVDWQQLKATFDQNTYYPAELHWRNQVVYDVAIRSRGLGSRSPVKPGLRVDINRYIKGQRFLGLTSFILDNAGQDASFLREHLSMLLFQRMGFPVPREAYARLYINGRYAGLYVIVEEVTKDFLRQNFGEEEGYLYEYKWGEPYHLEYLGADPQPYLDKFQPVTHDSQPDASVLEEMIRIINEAPDEDFPARISEYLDPAAFVTYLAVEDFIAEWDGMLGTEGMANFYLYRPTDQKRFTVIPWDKDVTFFYLDHPIDFNLTTNVLVRRLMASPELVRTYREALRTAALTAGGPGGWLDQELDRAYVLIRSSVYEDPSSDYVADAFEGQAGIVREFVRARSKLVLWLLEQTEATASN